MEWQQLRGFVEVARQGSFTRAAQALFLTQPAVSQQVKALEQELGCDLVVRGRRAVSLTPAGQVLQRRATVALAELEGARQELDALRHVVRGRVALATSDTNCTYVLPDVLRRFHATYPEVEVEVRNRMSREVEELVRAGDVDLGLLTLPAAERSLRAEDLFERRDVWICPPGHALARRASVQRGTAVRHPLLALERGSRSRQHLDDLLTGLPHGDEARIAMELGSIEIIKRFVEIGAGIALVPAVSVARDVDDGRLVAVTARSAPARRVGLVGRRGQPQSPAAQALAQMMRQDLSGLRL